MESADKSGEAKEGVRVDAGIVFAKNRYILCVMTTYLKDEAEGERAIEEISRTVYESISAGSAQAAHSDGRSAARRWRLT